MQRYFGTDGIRGEVGVSLINPEFILKFGWAIGMVLARHGPGKVLIGKDTRVSGYMLESALESGLSAAGMDIELLGPMPTPAVAYLTQTLRAAAGIVISASHNPYYDNGIKLFSQQGTKIPDHMEQAIATQMHEPMVMTHITRLGKARRMEGAPDRYIEFCKSKVGSHISFRGLKIVLDCAHGATYHIAPKVFRELGAEVIALNIKPNGYNINLDCGSTRPQSLVAAVREQGADCGIAFDGDGDRTIMVDHTGRVLDGDDILYILALAAKKNDSLVGDGVVGTIMSNYGLETALQEAGVAFERTAVGDRHVLALLQERGWALGAEPSGHVVNLAKTTSGDGIVTALCVLEAMLESDASLYELTQCLRKLPQKIVNVPSASKHDIYQNEALQSVLSAAKAALGHAGRIIVRPSGTEPVVRVMVESSDTALAQRIVLDVQQALQPKSQAASVGG